MKGKLYGVGVGPGDPMLLTLKAVGCLKNCDVIAIPGKNPAESVAYRIAREACPKIEEKEHLPIATPMTKDRVLLDTAYQKGAQKIETLLDNGKSVALLTLGDPTIYSTYIYIHRIVLLDGYEAEIVNGVPSFCAVAATLGDSLVDRDMQLHIIPASYQNDAALDLPGTKIFMKAGSKLGAVKDSLQNRDCDAVMIENCGMPGESVYDDKNRFPEDGSYYSIIVVKEPMHDRINETDETV